MSQAELDAAVRLRLKDREELMSLRNEDGSCIECGASVEEEEHAADCVIKRLEREVNEATKEWFVVVEKIPAAQVAYDDAVAAEAKYDSGDKPLPDKMAHKTDHTLGALFGWLDRKVVLEHRIKKLQSSKEIERRRSTSNRLKEVRRVASNGQKKESAKDQGVPGTYLSANGNFKPGLDARYKSDLITSALGEKIGPNGMHQYTQENALERLAQRNWLPFLEKAKASRAAKAEKKLEAAKATPRSSSAKATTKPAGKRK